MAKGPAGEPHGDGGAAPRKAREALEARVAELEGAQRDLSDLLGCVVHDLRNPLSVIASSLDLMREQLEPAQGLTGEALEEAQEATRRLRLMIDDVLLVARLQEAVALKREPFDLADLVRDVTGEYLRAAQDRQIDLFAQPAKHLLVTTDRSMLQRLLQRVLESSLRFTPARGRVAVAMRAEGDVQITVAHTGPAIPEPERVRLFDPGSRPGAQTRARRGSGMSLYFCKRAANALGGDIEVVETAEWPTTFVVHIPAA